MRSLMNKKYIFTALYIAALFAVIYGCKYLMDAAVYAITNLDRLLGGLADGIGRILGIFAIVVLGFVIAYILDPAVTFIQKKFHTKRIWAVTLIYIFIILLIAAAAAGIINKIIIYDSSDLSNAFFLAYENYKTQFNELYDKFYLFIRHYDLLGAFSNLKSHVADRFDYLRAARSFGKWAANIFLGLITAFYFLKDKDRILYVIEHSFSLILPSKVFDVTKQGINDIHEVFSGYIRGQFTDALLMSILISSSLSILRIPFAIPIGIISGFTNIIPFFGAIIGFLLAVTTALLSHGIFKAIVTAVILLLIQQADSIIIVPRIVGENVSLSPVMVIIALGIAGNIFGIWGMVFAVPVTALCKIFLEKGLHKLEIRRLEQIEEKQPSG